MNNQYNHTMDANSIKNQAKNIIKGKSKAPSSSNNDPDIEIIEHFTDFSPVTIHSKTKERIKHIGTVKYGETSTSAKSYVNSKLSLSEIKEKAKAKLRKNDENKCEASTSSVPEPPSKKAKISNPTSSSFREYARAAALFTPRIPEQREPSPEVEILEVKELGTPSSAKTTSSELQEIAKLLFNNNEPDKPSDNVSVEPPNVPYTPLKLGKASSSGSLIVPIPVSLPPRTVSQTPRRLTEESSESVTVPKPVIGEPRTVFNTQSSRTPMRLIGENSGSVSAVIEEPRTVSQTPRKLVGESSGSGIVPNAVTPQPRTVLNTHSPWTPRRLGEETPTKPSTSKEPSSTSPKRGVKRLMQDGENGVEEASTSNGTQHLISKFAYLEAFKLMLTSVWQCPQNAPVFDLEDVQKFSLFMTLSDAAKALYVQLLKMKLQWRQVSSLKYPDISSDMVPVIKELVLQQFLDSDDNLDDLPELLGMLKMPELKALTQEFQLQVKGRKMTMMTALIDHARLQRSIANGFLQANQVNIKSRIVQRLKAILGPCVRLSQDMADTMHGCFLLGTLSSCHSEETFSQFVLRIHKVRTKQLIYPDVHLQRCRQIFPNKPGFLKFQAAHRLFQEGQRCVTDKNWDGVITVANTAKEMFSEILHDELLRKFDEELPLFLRNFTAGSTLASAINFGLDAFGRRKDYATVVQLLELLLSQTLYRKRKRGFWYERLALTLHVHLKSNNKLLNRGRAWKPPPHLHTALSNLLKFPLIGEVGTTTIQAKSRQSKGQGLRLDYVHESSDGEQVVVSSVEEFAISYYKTKEEFTEGLHAEGSTIVSLFGIIFWDIIYDKYVPDVFLSPHQEKPLDLYGNEFYEHRKKDVEARLEEIQNWGDDEAITFLQGMWEQHCGKVSLVNWHLFRNHTHAQELLLSIGQFLMVQICRRLSTDFRMSRSGFPDLVLWSPSDRRCKFVEVKGPGDTLSNNQKVWLHFLSQQGGDVEVCHVQTVSTKYLQ
ncbi:hypothetical protein B566_EDAN015848 [Ephemera danica]|nr:hypothetical protein B566_EDAN015848 [Ephemera danica]